MFYHGLIAFDHVQHRLWIVRNVFTEGHGSLRSKYDSAAEEIQRTRKCSNSLWLLKSQRSLEIARNRKSKINSNFGKDGYPPPSAKRRNTFVAGDVFQVVISQRFPQNQRASFRNFPLSANPSLSLAFQQPQAVRAITRALNFFCRRVVLRRNEP